MVSRAREEERQSSDDEVALLALAVGGWTSPGSRRRKVHIRRDWGPAAHTCLWVPPPLSGSHVVWPFFLSSVLNHLSPASALLGFNPSLHLFGVFVPLPLSASFCLCNSSPAANVFPLQNLPSPDSSTPFSSLLTPRLFSSPLAPHCLLNRCIQASRQFDEVWEEQGGE